MMHEPEQRGGSAQPDERSQAEVVRSILKNADVQCPHCGHNLRDLAGERCIECGEQLVARELLRGPELPRTLDHVLLQLSLSVWLVASAIMIPFAPAIAPTGSGARPVISIAALVMFVGFVWLTIRVLKNPRGLLHLSRGARIMIRACNIATIVFAVAAAIWCSLWIVSAAIPPRH
jgi:hypothetical protein